jgi:ribulose-5-phosphate 4-epimerase/fuculose-1-phosphate aldolase
MTFRPTADRLAPELSEREQIVLLARALWHEGYDDHLAGHITVNQGDGTLLCNPWLLTWAEFGPDDVIRIDLDGNVLEGDWPAPLGIPLHLELHKARPGIGWALHHHSRWGTVWADMKRVPPIHDQTGAGGGGELVLVDEYDGNVGNADAAAKAVEKLGDAELALLAHHGVFVLGKNVNAAYWRAASLEWRCRNAGFVEQGGGGPGVPLVVHDSFGRSDGTGFTGYWETAVRRELRRDPELAARIGMASTSS